MVAAVAEVAEPVTTSEIVDAFTSAEAPTTVTSESNGVETTATGFAPSVVFREVESTDTE